MGALGQQFKTAQFWINEHWVTLAPEFLNQDQYCQVLKQECPIAWDAGSVRSQEDCAALKLSNHCFCCYQCFNYNSVSGLQQKLNYSLIIKWFFCLLCFFQSKQCLASLTLYNRACVFSF